MRPLPSRTLTRSNAQYKRALKRLPLGVASTFRYWGDDRTIYVSHGKGGRIVGHRRQRLCRLPAWLRPGDPWLCR